MRLKFSSSTFLALAAVTTTTTTTTTYAFLAPSNSNTHRRSLLERKVGSWDNDDFLEALSGGNPQQEHPPKYQPEEDESRRVDGDQGGSRLKHMMSAMRQQDSSQGGFRPVENPFLTPPSTAPAAGGMNPQEMSVEEQARRFREMMMMNVQPQGTFAPQPPQSTRPTSRTDRAGRPVGRNRDADTIANSADLYFAQLKRDSSVRGMARIRGDDEAAENVFADSGIKELEGMMYENPYLKGQRDKERDFIDAIPEEFIKPYFDPDALPEEERTTSGISYRELMKQRRRQQQGKPADAAAQVQDQQVAPSPPQPPAPVIATFQPPPQPQQQQQPPTSMAPPQSVVPPQAVSQPPPVEQQQQRQAAAVSQAAVTEPTTTHVPPPVPKSVTSSSDDTQRKMRTLMGMLLKHRGGPGFGKGRLSPREIDLFSNLNDEVITFLREEAMKNSTPANTVPPPSPPLTQVSMPPPQSFAAVPPPVPMAASTVPVVAAVPANAPPQLDSMIACVDGAITMYKNCPPELQPSILATLRAALASAVNTCDGAIGYVDPNPAPVMSQVGGTIAVIEGAMMMYKNSPPELRPSVLLALRAAFRTAVSTYDTMLGGVPPQISIPPPPPQVSVPPVVPVAPFQPPPPVTIPSLHEPQPSAVMASPSTIIPATDPNSKVLEGIYHKMKTAAGNGSLGLRSDLTSEDASELADELMSMRRVLMEELDAGIPDPVIEEKVEETIPPTPNNPTVSKYQQMLARAKAEKAAGAS